MATLWAHDSLAQGPFGPAGHGMPHDGSHLAQMATHIEAAANATASPISVRPTHTMGYYR